MQSADSKQKLGRKPLKPMPIGINQHLQAFRQTLRATPMTSPAP
jgi:hypothetical protein